MILSVFLYAYVLPLVLVASISSVLFFLGLAVGKEIVSVDAYVSCLFFACYPLDNIVVASLGSFLYRVFVLRRVPTLVYSARISVLKYQ